MLRVAVRGEARIIIEKTINGEWTLHAHHHHTSDEFTHNQEQRRRESNTYNDIDTTHVQGNELKVDVRTSFC